MFKYRAEIPPKPFSLKYVVNLWQKEGQIWFKVHWLFSISIFNYLHLENFVKLVFLCNSLNTVERIIVYKFGYVSSCDKRKVKLFWV